MSGRVDLTRQLRTGCVGVATGVWIQTIGTRTFRNTYCIHVEATVVPARVHIHNRPVSTASATVCTENYRKTRAISARNARLNGRKAGEVFAPISQFRRRRRRRVCVC